MRDDAESHRRRVTTFRHFAGVVASPEEICATKAKSEGCAET